MIEGILTWAAGALTIGAGVGFTLVFFYIGFMIIAKPFDWLERRFSPDKEGDE
jgi:hypothetical protein